MELDELGPSRGSDSHRSDTVGAGGGEAQGGAVVSQKAASD